jgi:uncharacterized membrane protein YoaK (UPF0700 family)
MKWKASTWFSRPHPAATHTQTEAAGDETSRRELLFVPHEHARVVLVILALTLNAGWVDTLAFLSLGRVFASFLSGNFVFMGLAVAQGNRGLLIRALVGVLVSFVGTTIASLWLQRALRRRAEPTWRNTFVPLLLVEGLIFLTFAILWRVTNDLGQHGGIQVVLLALAGLGMGIQGALVGAFKLPGVVANALTGTVLTLGQRFAQGIGHTRSTNDSGRWANRVLLILPLLYVLSAIVVALTAASGFPPVVPVVIVTAATCALLVPSTP